MREFKIHSFNHLVDTCQQMDIVHRTHHVEHTATDTPRTHKDTGTNGAREDDGGKLRLELELRSRAANVRGRSGARSAPIELSILPAILDTGEPPSESHTYMRSHRVHAGTALPELLRPTDTRKR